MSDTHDSTGWSSNEKIGLLLGLVLVLLWVLATVLFGFAGLILVGVLLTFVVLGVIVVGSRG